MGTEMKLLEKYKIDLIVDSRERYKEAVLSLLERDRDATVLDVGCGDRRRLTYQILDRTGTTVKAFGLDLEHKKENRIEVRYCDLDDGLSQPFPFSPGFDVVIASQLIEHLRNTDNLIKEMYKVLKSGGYAVVSTPNLASWHNTLYLLLGKQPDVATVSDELYPWKEKPGHARVFTATELIKLLEFHGFIVEKIIGTSYYPLVGKLANWLARKDWRHAGNITVKVRKETAE